MSTPHIGFVKPHHVVFNKGIAVVTLSGTGAVHRLHGPAAAAARRVVAGETNPSLWTRDEQDALAVLCDLGVLEFADHGVNRRALITGATALGITTLMMPTAAAAESAGGGEGGGGGDAYLMVHNYFGNNVVDTSGVPGATVVRWSSYDSMMSFDNTISPMNGDNFGPVSIDYVLVGGGGTSWKPGSGGGGGGQVVVGSLTLTSQVIAEVGLGGSSVINAPDGLYSMGASGQSSRFMIQSYPSNLTLDGTTAALGGGGGYGWRGNELPGTGGASSYPGGTGSGLAAGGGGGGAGGAGGDGYLSESQAFGGTGGDGISISGFGASPILVGGGGGGAAHHVGGTNSYGGGTGATMETMTGNGGTHGTGGGGGGSMDFSSGANPYPAQGGRGLVMVKATSVMVS